MNSRVERGSHLDNTANEHSQNIYKEGIDENSRSRFNNFMKQQSMNFRACFSNDYSRNIGHQDIDYADGGNTINFWQAARQNALTSTANNKIEDQAQMHKIEQQNSQIDQNKKKGLKYLAWIINRLLRKRKYDHNQIVGECINYVLGKQNPQSPNVISMISQETYEKQSQNIRRRIYDAINVMSAIGLVAKTSASQIYVRKPEIANPVCYDRIARITNEGYANEDNEIIQNYKRLVDIKLAFIAAKKKYLESMRDKEKALSIHLHRNNDYSKIKRQVNIINLESNPAQIIKRQIKSESSNAQQSRIQFPFILIGSHQGEMTIQLCGKNRKQVSVKHQRNQLIVLSELDTIALLHADKSGKSTNETSKNTKNKNTSYFQQMLSQSEDDYFCARDQPLNVNRQIIECKIQKLEKNSNEIQAKKQEKCQQRQKITQKDLIFFQNYSRSSFQRYVEQRDKIDKIDKKDKKQREEKQQQVQENEAPNFKNWKNWVKANKLKK